MEWNIEINLLDGLESLSSQVGWSEESGTTKKASTDEVKQLYSRSKGAPCFELKCCVFSSYKLNELHSRVAAIKYTSSSGGLF